MNDIHDQGLVFSKIEIKHHEAFDPFSAVLMGRSLASPQWLKSLR